MKKIIFVALMALFSGFAFAEIVDSGYEADLTLGSDYENWVASGKSGRKWIAERKDSAKKEIESGSTKIAKADTSSKTETSKPKSETENKDSSKPRESKPRDPVGLQWKSEIYGSVGFGGEFTGPESMVNGSFLPSSVAVGYILWLADHFGIGVMDEIESNLFKVAAGDGPFYVKNKFCLRALYEWNLKSKFHIYHGVFGSIVNDPMDKVDNTVNFGFGETIFGFKIALNSNLNVFGELNLGNCSLFDAGVSFRF